MQLHEYLSTYLVDDTDAWYVPGKRAVEQRGVTGKHSGRADIEQRADRLVCPSMKYEVLMGNT